MKTIRVKISIDEYLKLGGTIESLVGQPVYKTQGDQWYNKKILDASSRVISKGKKKGMNEITITVEYTYVFKPRNVWIRKTSSMDKHFVFVNVRLANSETKLNDIMSKFLNIPMILNEELIKAYGTYGKNQSDNSDRTTL